jgi:hypothetical protein
MIQDFYMPRPLFQFLQNSKSQPNHQEKQIRAVQISSAAAHTDNGQNITIGSLLLNVFDRSTAGSLEAGRFGEKNFIAKYHKTAIRTKPAIVWPNPPAPCAAAPSCCLRSPAAGA